MENWKTTLSFYWWFIIPLAGFLIKGKFGLFFGLCLDGLIWIGIMMYNTLNDKHDDFNLR